MGNFLPFVGFTPWEIIVTICNTLITFLIVKKLLFGPVHKMMDARTQEVQLMYTSAEKAQTEAESMRSEYTERLAKAKEEAQEIVSSATRRATVRSEEIIKEANQQAASIKEKAGNDIEMDRKKAANEIKNMVADLSVQIATKVVEHDISKDEDHERFIKEFIEKVG